MTLSTLLPSLLVAVAPILLSSCTPPAPTAPVGQAPSLTAARPATGFEGVLSPLSYPGERHLANVRQLTFGMENAEAYWSEDGRSLIYQSTHAPYGCDQIFTLDVDTPGAVPRLVSTGKGRTTCSYFIPGTDRILYSSTHLGGSDCPPPPDMSQGYVWSLTPSYDVFSARRDGSDLRRLTDAPGYDAEATVSVDGTKVVFTSARDGDLEIYTMASNGSNQRRLTTTPGYDGGPFFSDDGSWIVFRASRPTAPAAIEEFRALLARGLVRPKALEIRTMRSDGTGDTQVTDNGAANFAPYFFRGGHDRIIFCSNLADPKGRNFDLFLIRSDGTRLERVTYNPTFDGFPMFSPDGRRLAFCSNRHNARAGETNVFVADWVE